MSRGVLALFWVAIVGIIIHSLYVIRKARREHKNEGRPAAQQDDNQ